MTRSPMPPADIMRAWARRARADIARNPHRAAHLTAQADAWDRAADLHDAGQWSAAAAAMPRGAAVEVTR